ncbi:hypothetical protein SRHO_G00006850 [Serrasalmus rhombeus]
MDHTIVFVGEIHLCYGVEGLLRLETCNSSQYFHKGDTEQTRCDVFATSPFEKGRFIVEYRGKLFKENSVDQFSGNVDYLYTFCHDGIAYCIDVSSEDGSLGRLCNDSVKPNTKMKIVIPHLCLFALKDIDVGDEITYDYGGQGLPWRKKKSKKKKTDSPGPGNISHHYRTGDSPGNENAEALEPSFVLAVTRPLSLQPAPSGSTDPSKCAPPFDGSASTPEWENQDQDTSVGSGFTGLETQRPVCENAVALRPRSFSQPTRSSSTDSNKDNNSSGEEYSQEEDSNSSG